MVAKIVVDEGGLAGESFTRKSVGQWGAGAVMGASGVATRSGVVPALNNPLGYVVSSGLKGNLLAGRYNLWTPNGYVPVDLEADIELTHETANGAQPRRDLVIVEVIDVGTSASIRQFRIVKGIATSGAPLPTTNWAAGQDIGVGTPGDAGVAVGSGGWAVLHQVTIAANDTTLAQADVADVRTYSYGAGGLAHVKGAALTPSLAASLPPWTPVFDEDAPNHLFIRDATTGLYDLDGRDRVAQLNLSRTNAPGTGADSNGSGGFLAGWLLEFAADSSAQVGPAPAYSITGPSNSTQLVIGESGLYSLDGSTDQRGASNSVPNADGFIELRASTDNGVTWFTLPGGIHHYKSGWFIQQFHSTKYKLAAGNRIQVILSRSIGQTETILGKMSLTQHRTLV